MIINPAEILPNVTDQKTFFLKENDLEEGWCVIFVQVILACKNARKKPKSQMNFVTRIKFKTPDFCNVASESQFGNPAQGV